MIVGKHCLGLLSETVVQESVGGENIHLFGLDGLLCTYILKLPVGSELTFLDVGATAHHGNRALLGISSILQLSHLL